MSDNMGKLSFDDQWHEVPVEICRKIWSEIVIEQPFPKGWRAIEFKFSSCPNTIIQWFNFLWGWDIWYEHLPVVKSLILINILVWLLIR
jgi:hypothetical protein